MTRRRLLAAALALPLAWPAPVSLAAHAPDQPSDKIAAALMPKRELDLIAIYADARKQFAAARTVDERAGVRTAMQIRVENLLQESVQITGWTGVILAAGKTREGDAWVKIAIAPDFTVMTSQTLADDPHYVTLIKGSSELAKTVITIGFNQPVRFNGTIVRILLDRDEVMVEQPTYVARITELKEIE